MQTRLNININTQTQLHLKEYAQKHEITITEAVRRLVNTGHFIAKAQDDGKKVIVGNDRVTFNY